MTKLFESFERTCMNVKLASAQLLHIEDGKRLTPEKRKQLSLALLALEEAQDRFAALKGSAK